MSKSKGGLGFRSLYGFNIGLLGKYCWSFMQNPNTLVARLYKAKYFLNSHILRAQKGTGSSIIWSRIWTAKEKLYKGFRWVVGNGKDINAVKDQWLNKKVDFCVENSSVYDDRSELVSSLLLPKSNQWNVSLVQQLYLDVDAKVILVIPVPQREINDRIAWAESTNGVYTAKAGYHFGHAQNIGTLNVPQSEGWSKIWRLQNPHKLKIFVWHFCRNTVLVCKCQQVSVSWGWPI